MLGRADAAPTFGGKTGSGLSCVMNHVSQVDCFGVGTDGSLVANYYANAGDKH
jgi:hypothetical protein